MILGLQLLRGLVVTCCMGLIFSSLHAEVVLTDMKGAHIPFSSLKGKWIMINYWAGWCQPCLDEIRELNAFYKQNHDKVALFAVNYDALPKQEQLALIAQLDIRYPSLSKNPGGQLGIGYLRGVPATFVFNTEGHYVDTLYGGQTRRSLNRALRG